MSNRRPAFCAAFLLTAAIPCVLNAQIEKLTETQLRANASESQRFAERTANPVLKKNLLAPKGLLKASNAARVAADMEAGQAKDADFAFYASAADRVRRVLKDQQDTAALKGLNTGVLNYPGMPNAAKIGAEWSNAEQEAFAGDSVSAEKTMRSCLAYEKLSDVDRLSIYTHLARLYFWRQDCDGAIKCYNEMRGTTKNPGQLKSLARLMSNMYCLFLRYDDAVKIWRENGNRLGEASVMKNVDPAKARTLAKAVLADPKTALPDRIEAFLYFLENDAECKAVRAQYVEGATDSFAPGSPLYFHFKLALGRAFRCQDYGSAAEFARYLRHSAEFAKNFDLVRNYVFILLYNGNFAEAGKMIAEYGFNPTFTPEQKLFFQLAENIRPDADTARFRKIADDAKNLKPQELSNAVNLAARVAFFIHDYRSAEVLQNMYEKMLVPLPKKTYTVIFFDTPIKNISDFLALKNKPAVQLMNRAFGGNLDFLETDVSTGNRGSGIGSEKDSEKPFTQFSALCDENGLHLFFYVQDSKADEIKAGLRSGGGFEMYLAPGENQPYTCLMPALPNPGKVDLWQTTYNNEFYRRLRDGVRDVVADSAFDEHGFHYHMFISWNQYFDKLPESKNDFWEFENIGWSQAGGYSWNGTRSIHGRSTWGRLEFNISPAQAARIKRRIIVAALEDYKAEKVTSHRLDGCGAYWQDPVLGDVDFYQKKVAPLVAKLDSYLPLVKAGMSDADTEKVFAEALPGWRNIRFTVERHRREYLEEKLTE